MFVELDACIIFSEARSSSCIAFNHRGLFNESLNIFGSVIEEQLLTRAFGIGFHYTFLSPSYHLLLQQRRVAFMLKSSKESVLT